MNGREWRKVSSNTLVETPYFTLDTIDSGALLLLCTLLEEEEGGAKIMAILDIGQ